MSDINGAYDEVKEKPFAVQFPPIPATVAVVVIEAMARATEAGSFSDNPEHERDLAKAGRMFVDCILAAADRN